jgi:hypothetical protein
VRHIEKYGSIHIAYPSSLGETLAREQKPKQLKRFLIVSSKESNYEKNGYF